MNKKFKVITNDSTGRIGYVSVNAESAKAARALVKHLLELEDSTVEIVTVLEVE